MRITKCCPWRMEAVIDSALTPQRTRQVDVGGKLVETDSEGYLLRLSDWSEAFAIAQAASEDLPLTDEHWQVIDFLRNYYHDHQVQAQVRVMIRHFTQKWGPDRGNNHYLHDLFPRGGPQKQGNRLAGLLRTKGEH
ncbi:MAG: TusE/DsrC/DsvC family sulfur relay protein [Thermomicrobiales bacterium]|jgi:tRNA 2-thiouridine synthesizing protein E|nr:MAG: TusE/DsrC/DsvC family sulfur relay protein [Thermomicrobiales bacterium]